MPKDETRIIHCPRCHLRTRHTKDRMVRRPLLLLLMGRVRVLTGWRCNECGHRLATGSRAVPTKLA